MASDFYEQVWRGMCKVLEMVGTGRSMTTALCKMICVRRNKWCIEMTNGAAEVQLGCSVAGVPPGSSMEGVRSRYKQFPVTFELSDELMI